MNSEVTRRRRRCHLPEAAICWEPEGECPRCRWHSSLSRPSIHRPHRPCRTGPIAGRGHWRRLVRHDGQGSFNFFLPTQVPSTLPGPYQDSWRYCKQCGVLFFDGLPSDKGVCSGGTAGHVADGLMFLLPHDRKGGIAPKPLAWEDWRKLVFDPTPGKMLSGPGACSFSLGGPVKQGINLFALYQVGSALPNMTTRTYFTGPPEDWWEPEYLDSRPSPTMQGDPAAVSWGYVRIDVFAVSDKSELWHLATVGGDFPDWGKEWENLGGQLTSSPGRARGARITLTYSRWEPITPFGTTGTRGNGAAGNLSVPVPTGLMGRAQRSQETSTTLICLLSEPIW